MSLNLETKRERIIKSTAKYRWIGAILRWGGWMLVSVFVLLLLLQLLIMLPPVQKKLKNVVESALEEQLDATATVGEFRLGFPKKLRAGSILVTGKKADTLAYVGSLSIDVAILPLLKKKIVIQRVELEQVKGDISKILALTTAPNNGGEPEASEATAGDAEEVNNHPWTFEVRNLEMQSVDLNLRDKQAGIDIAMMLGQIHIGLGEIDLESLIKVRSILVSHTDVLLRMFESEAVEELDTASVSFANILVQQLLLEDVHFNLIDSVSGMSLNTYAGKLSASGNFLNMTRAVINVDEVDVVDSYCDLVFLPEVANAEAVDGLDDSTDLNWGQYLWRITGNRLSLDNCRYTMDYTGEPVSMGHFDPLHLRVLEASGQVSAFILDVDTLTARIENLRANDGHGFEILQFDADISRHDSMLVIHELNLLTPNTKLLLELETAMSPTNYNSLAEKNFDLNLSVNGSNWLDADYFYPFLGETEWLTDDFATGNFEVSAAVEGNLQDISIQSFAFQLLDSTRIVVKGNVNDGIDPEKRRVNLDIEELKTNRLEIQQSFNTGISDSVVTLPAFVNLHGRYEGLGDSHRFRGKLESSNGIVTITEATVNIADRPNYSLNMEANLYHLDKLAPLDLGQAAFRVDANLEGDDPANYFGTIDMQIDSLNYLGSHYEGLLIQGGIDNGKYAATFKSAMPELSVSLDAGGILNEDSVTVKLSLLAEHIDIQALNFYSEAIQLEGQAELAAAMYPNESYDLSLSLLRMELKEGDSSYILHPLELEFNTHERYTHIDLQGNFFKLVFNAEDQISGLVRAFKKLPGHYMADNNFDTATFFLPQFNVSGSLEYPQKVARLFFPQVPDFGRLTIDGAYDQETDKLGIRIDIPVLETGGLHSDSLYVDITGSSEQLMLESGAKIDYNDLLSGHIFLNGNFHNSEINSRLVYEDSYSEKYLDLAVRIDTSNGNVLLHLLPPSLVFSYDKWSVNPNNLVTINPGYILFEQFDLSHEGEKISVSSSDAGGSGSTTFNLTDFSLGSLERLFNLDTVVSGKANAEVTVFKPLGDFSVSGDLLIDQFQLFDYYIGQLSIPRIYYREDTALLKLAMTGDNQDIYLDGSWIVSDSLNPFRADLEVKTLNLSELNYLLKDQINNARGKLEGSIKLSGKPADPLVNGYVKFNNAGMDFNFLNNAISLGTEKIMIRNNVLEFSQFTIENTKKQAARIDGSINLGDMSKAYTNLTVKTDNMEIMNSTQKNNDILFGLLKAGSQIEAKGEVSDIRLNAEVTIDKSTNLTYIFPDDLALDNNSGLVHYNKFDPEAHPDEDVIQTASFLSLQSFRNVRSKIEIEPGARFNLYFDSQGSNFLNARLNGIVNYRQVEGNSEISGTFRVQDGILRYGIPMVAVEEYKIEPGSFITLSNDLYNPYLNLVASSSVRASTEGLISGDAKVMTFKVLLYMEGELNDLKLRFDIAQETSDAVVSSRLAQLSEVERNINALNLLVRGSFVVSLQGDEVGGTSTVDAQIDKFYATHLNHLIGENIGFVDLKFDVQSFKEYNAYGETVMQRNYYYNVGKSFFKDRARINYKGSLGVTSDLQGEQVNSRFVQDQLEVEVLVTKDGVLRAVFFRKNQYEGLLEGEVIETGGGIRLRKDFYSIGDIFTSEKRKTEKEKEQLNQKTKQ